VQTEQHSGAVAKKHGLRAPAASLRPKIPLQLLILELVEGLGMGSESEVTRRLPSCETQEAVVRLSGGAFW